MSTNKKTLAPDQKELVAIGASVGAGCLPCSSYHFNLSRKMGIETGRMLAAALEAESVVNDAKERLSAHVHDELDPDTGEPAEMPLLDRELAALGAAIAANSFPNIRRHILEASKCGLSRRQLAEAIGIAGRVQQKAGSGHIDAAARFLERLDAKPGENDAVDDAGAPPAAAAGEKQPMLCHRWMSRWSGRGRRVSSCGYGPESGC